MHLRFLLPIFLLVLLRAASPANIRVAEGTGLQTALARFQGRGTGDGTATLKNNSLFTPAGSGFFADSKTFNAPLGSLGSLGSSSCVNRESCCTQRSDEAASIIRSGEKSEAGCCVACHCNIQDAPPLPQNVPSDLPPASTSDKGLAPQTIWVLAVQEGFQRNLAAIYAGRYSCSAFLYRTHGTAAVQSVELTVLHCALQI